MVYDADIEFNRIFNMHKIFISSILALSAASVSAATLEQALTSGYDYDEKFKTNRTDFLNEIEAFPKALSEFMPRVSASFDSTNSKVTKKSDVGVADNTSSNNLRYTRSLNVEQPIFNGWSSVSNLKAAQAGFRAARGAYYAKEQENFLQEIDLYLSTVEAQEKLTISKVSVRSNQTQLDAMKEKFRLGESTETEVASAREGLSTAKSLEAQAYANFANARANFERVFGMPADDIKFPEVPSDLPISLDHLIDEAVNVNPSVDSVINTASSAKASAAAAKGSLLPRVAFRLQYGQNFYNPQDARNNTVNSETTTSVLSVTVPILERGGAEYSEVRKAKYQAKKASLNYDSVIKQIRANAKAGWSKFEASKHRIEAAREAVNAAKIAYDGMIQEEMLGSKTIVDVLRAEEKLNKAREAKVEANKAMIFAAYEIKSLIGKLTAKSMNLNVKHFSPESEFKKVKLKIVGF